jgi:hypothetical protein
MAIAALSLAVGCGGDDDVCDPVAQSGCDDGFVCEVVQAEDGGEADPGCFAPVLVRGQVFDLQASTPVADANIVGLDVNGAAATSVAVSDIAGNYELVIPSTRRSDGTPIPVELTLRADASGYQTFPSGVRQSLPVDTSTAVVDGDSGPLVVDSALTDIGLLAFPAGSPTGSIAGSVSVPDDGAGVLVVATDGGGVGHAGIANRDGGYEIFNLGAGEYEVTAYARGRNYEAVQVSLADAERAIVDLSAVDVATGTVSGTVQIVNAPGGSVTSVILVVESTFDELLARGQAVPGLRAPPPPAAGNIAGEYSIEGVPAGNYVVLAAFENDDLVRDPDLSIGGTSILHITVEPGGDTVVDGFKVTEALAVLSPGADAPEPVSEPLTLSWDDDSSEDEYIVEVFDAFGEQILMSSIPGVSGAIPTYDYDGPALESGMFYQMRVTSLKDGVPLSRTEDLRGVFFVP